MGGISTLAPRMIGRQAEMETLRAYLDLARAGTGRVVFLAGDAGVGKSRLLREFLAHIATHDGVEALEGHCYDEDPVVPYGPFVDAIYSFMRVHGAEAIARAAGPRADDLAPLFPELAPEGPAAPPVEPQSHKRRLFEALYRVLQPQSGQRCRLVVLEDLHWLDQTSGEFVQYLARAIARERILVLATYRSDELHRRHPLTHLIAQLNRERLYQEVRLAPLSSAEVARMLDATLQRALPSALVGALYRHTEGNPFFVEEVLKALVEHGQLDAMIDTAHLGGAVDHPAIPVSIKDSILSRTVDLDATTDEVLGYAAVVGRHFGFDLLLRLTGLEEDALVRALALLIERQLVVEDAGGCDDFYRFRHALTREAVYDDLLGRERRLKHRAVLRILEEAHSSNPESVIDQLAYHSLRARELEKAARYARLAAQRASCMYAHREAVAHYEVALDLLDGDDPRERADLFDALGAAAYPLGDVNLSARYWREAQRLYEEVGDRRKVADVYRRLARVAWERGDTAEAFRHTRAALDVLEAEPPGSELAMAYSALSQLYMLSSQPRESIVWGEKALRLAEDIGCAAARSHALNNIGDALADLGEAQRGLALLEQSLAVALDAGAVNHALRAYHNLATRLLSRGDLTRAAQLAQDGLALADRTGYELGARALLCNALGEVAMLHGQWDRAHELVDQALDAGETGYPIARIFAAPVKGELLIRQGRPDEARTLLDAVLPVCERQGEFQTLGSVLLILARLHMACGQHEDAVAAMDRCIALWRGIGSIAWSSAVLGYAVEVYMAAGHGASAAELLLELTARVGQDATPMACARLAEAQGFVVAGAGEHGAAADHFAHAAALWAEMGVPLEESLARRRRVESLLSAGEADARATATRELAAARRALESLGALRELMAVDAVVKRHSLEPRPARSLGEHKSGLTRREREVIALIARGRSNREIAAELVISEKTAEVHVGNILGKLGFNSRAQAAAYAVAEGLAASPVA